MARRVSQKKEEVMEAAEPAPLLTEDIEVDLDSPLTESKPSGNGSVPAELGGPEIEVETGFPIEPVVDDEKESLRRRVAEMEASEVLSRQNQAAAQQLIDQLAQKDQQSQQKISQSQWNAARSEYDATVNAIAAATSEIGALKDQIRQAGTEGNWDVIAEAQSQIGTLSYDLRANEQRKTQLETWSRQVKQQRQQQPRQQQQPQQQQPQQVGDPVEAQIANSGMPDRAKIWLRRHREYMEDAALNDKLQKAHEKVERETGSAFTDAYFGRMEEELGLKANSSKPAVQSTQSGRSGGSVSAPPTREAPSMSTGKSAATTKITLSADQRQVAAQIAESQNGGKRPGDAGWMSQAEAERVYAKNLLKINSEKVN